MSEVSHIPQLHVIDNDNVRNSLFWNAMTIVTIVLAVERHLYKNIITIIIIIYLAQNTIKLSNMTIHEQDRQGCNALTAAL